MPQHQGEKERFVLPTVGQQAPGLQDETGIDVGEFPNQGETEAGDVSPRL